MLLMESLFVCGTVYTGIKIYKKSHKKNLSFLKSRNKFDKRKSSSPISVYDEMKTIGQRIRQVKIVALPGDRRRELYKEISSKINENELSTEQQELNRKLITALGTLSLFIAGGFGYPVLILLAMGGTGILASSSIRKAYQELSEERKIGVAVH